EEPAAGWIEGVKVADAIILAYAREKVTLFPGKRSGVIDVIPVDLVANSIILALAEALAEPGKQRIYQCCSVGSNPVTLGEFNEQMTAESNIKYAVYDHMFNRQLTTPCVVVKRVLFSLLITGGRLHLSFTERVLKLLASGSGLKW